MVLPVGILEEKGDRRRESISQDLYYPIASLEWFKAKGKGYQTRMNAVLRAYIELHRKGHKKAS